jgi:peptidoglycan/LPS O-acetylase OafA/YrhL
MRRLPSLDGIRGIAILIVLLAHASHTAHFPLPAWLVDRGLLGVQIFFVLSGYLITTLLLEERSKTGTIDLRRFYLRRALRIFPASYCFMAILALFALTGKNDLLFGATYTTNYHMGGSWNLGHLWSLSVEEQFYLCWPLAMQLLSLDRALAAAGAIVAGAPLIVGMFYFVHYPGAERIHRAFPLIADAIASGCVLAILLARWHALPRLKRIMTHHAGLLAPVAVVLIYFFASGHPRLFVPAEWATNLGIAYSIARWSRFSGDGPRVLNHGWLPRLGVLSYSVYLWQQPFLNASVHSWATAFPQNIGLALAAGIASYYLLERPLLGLRQRFHREKPVAIKAQHVLMQAAAAAPAITLVQAFR